MQSVLKRCCQSTIMGGACVTSHRQTARFEKGVKNVDKKKTLGEFLSL